VHPVGSYCADVERNVS